ncbi:hypothetical protein KR200_009574, partial [Drosophila serrata]
RNWDYEPISLKSFTSDEKLLKIQTKVDRLGRADFAFSMTLDWNYDVIFNKNLNHFQVEAIVYRSSSGAKADYKLLPWSVPRQPFYEYLDNYYKDVVMKIFSHCSNLPQFQGKFQPPWPSKTYVVDKCVFDDADGLPEIAPPGFYKIIFNFSGPHQPSWGIVAVLKITPKLF